MVTIQVAPVYDLDVRATYLTLGVGERRKSHETAGTDRLQPGSFIDAADMAEFVALGKRLTNGRRVKAQSLVVSFSPSEIDKSTADDQRLVGAAATEIARRAFPGALIAVVVHSDGGAPHAHVLALNDIDGHAIRENRTHWKLKHIADDVARENGLSTIEKPRAKTAVPAWAERRDNVSAFDRQLGDAIAEVLADKSITSWAAFRTALEANGITLDIREEAQRRGPRASQTVTGLTFRALDETGQGKHRVRRRKASSLSQSFSHSAITTALEARRAAASDRPSQSPVPSTARAIGNVIQSGHSSQRNDLVRILDRTLTAGLFLSLDGWALTLARVGVTVLRAQHREQRGRQSLLIYRHQGETFPEDVLPDHFNGKAVERQAREIAALRRIAPEHAKALPVPQLIDVVADERPRRRRRSGPVLPQSPARERHLQRGLELG
ncbi:relaxase/mobilization nuclease domain-containing protein [Microbacterium esteraromaticum]|uniref:Relaxase/mobilization nuclease domain-containing protein n=1 Tax=Microbacterium esteraromaticum TaxID=57043 RepID=A0A7D7W7C8_9MICO|nr:relaxase/mobilization nuclease domain-containing protein [Microbacterium esteraromaticum]QMU96298.1 relaxase/mobilization nuclease domain-containing protein [Microbacterium esteraromaticum]